MSTTAAPKDKDVPADLSAPRPSAAEQELPKFNFEVSPVPPNPLGEGRYIRTAAALVIGYVSFTLPFVLSRLVSSHAGGTPVGSRVGEALVSRPVR